MPRIFKKIINNGFALLFVLLFFDLLTIIFHFLFGRSIGFFNLDKEQNFISLYTGIKFWFGGTVAVLNWVVARSIKQKEGKRLWLLVALGLFWIGLDDLYYLHERFTFVLNNALGMGGFYGESFNWLLYFSPFIVLAFLIFAKLVIFIFKNYKLAALFLLGGTLLFVAALGTEIYGRQLLLSIPIPVDKYRALIVLEEVFELLGASTFIFGVILYFKKISRKFITIAAD